MKKVWLSLMGTFMVVPTTLAVVSCGHQKLGWRGTSYWWILNYHDFSAWMKNVDLISPEAWKKRSLAERKKSWAVVQNVNVNNFMTILNLNYQYLLSEKLQKAEPKAVDELGGFYHDFNYAVLHQSNSFASQLRNLKYGSQSLISGWKPWKKEKFYKDFKTGEPRNKFQFQTEGGEVKPIEMAVTGDDGQTVAESKIVEIWTPIFEEIMNPKRGNSEAVIAELWSGLQSWSFEAFIFQFHLFWPTEENLKVTFQINLTFDF